MQREYLEGEGNKGGTCSLAVVGPGWRPGQMSYSQLRDSD